MGKRKVRKSIYKEQIQDLNVTDLLLDIVDQGFEADWQFNLDTNWDKKVEKALNDLDFHQYDFYFTSNTYWCGILYADPFGSLMYRYTEEEILNIIKDQHLKLVWEEAGLILRFFNPTSSPLYRFFNQHKEDGYGLNVTTSVNELVRKIKQYLEQKLSANLDSYGKWELVESEQEEDDQVA